MPKGVRPRGRVSQGEGGLACTGRGDGRLHRRGARGTGSLGEGGSTSSGPGEGPLGGVRPRRGEPPRERGLTRVSRGSTASETVALVAKGSRGEGHSGGVAPAGVAVRWAGVGNGWLPEDRVLGGRATPAGVAFYSAGIEEGGLPEDRVFEGRGIRWRGPRLAWGLRKVGVRRTASSGGRAPG